MIIIWRKKENNKERKLTSPLTLWGGEGAGGAQWEAVWRKWRLLSLRSLYRVFIERLPGWVLIAGPWQWIVTVVSLNPATVCVCVCVSELLKQSWTGRKGEEGGTGREGVERGRELMKHSPLRLKWFKRSDFCSVTEITAACNLLPIPRERSVWPPPPPSPPSLPPSSPPQRRWYHCPVDRWRARRNERTVKN